MLEPQQPDRPRAPEDAICRHFGVCGGCAWQGLSADVYLARKRKLISDALTRHGIPEKSLREIACVPPRSRRRATLKVQKLADETRIGFHAPRSHDLIDIRECHVLTPGLFELAQGLRDIFSKLLHAGETADLYMVEADNGFDLAISWKRNIGPELTADIASAAARLGLIRVTKENRLLFETGAPQVAFGRAQVKLPPNAFLQPTREGESLLQARAAAAVGKAKRVADLFAGCGTFTFPLAEHAQIHAVDADEPMLGALAEAARGTRGLKPIAIEARDLFKRPLRPAELARFDAAVLDPPRAGALAQATNLSQSSVRRIAYISCNAASFARDARVLIDGGFKLDWIVGVDQFLWSAHIELAAALARH